MFLYFRPKGGIFFQTRRKFLTSEDFPTSVRPTSVRTLKSTHLYLCFWNVMSFLTFFDVMYRVFVGYVVSEWIKWLYVGSIWHCTRFVLSWVYRTYNWMTVKKSSSMYFAWIVNNYNVFSEQRKNQFKTNKKILN